MPATAINQSSFVALVLKIVFRGQYILLGYDTHRYGDVGFAWSTKRWRHHSQRHTHCLPEKSWDRPPFYSHAHNTPISASLGKRVGTKSAEAHIAAGESTRSAQPRQDWQHKVR